MKMTTYDIPKHEGFKHLNPKSSDYEKAVTGIFNEMKLRQQDKDVENIQKSNLIIKNKMMLFLARSNAKWDHKPVLKKHISSYFHKKLTNAKGRPATVFGTMIPGDNKYLYDHDIWSNIHYGYAGKLSDVYGWNLDIAGRLNDVANGHFNNVIGDKNTDANAVNLGMYLFDKYGTDLKKSDLEREVFNNRAKLNRYERKDLIEKLHIVKAGDTIFNIAKENNIAPEEILHKNPQLTDVRHLIPGTALKMPDPTEIRMLSDKDLNDVLNSSAYLFEHGEEHDKLVEVVKHHFEAKEDYKNLTALLNIAADAPLYVWETQNDDRVRAEHAERNGGVFDAENPQPRRSVQLPL
ncbi:MAG TPA: hypothetical protein DD624_05870 [Alphaproteobacteria bacterium]|nr:hypothetical protein [Alphaproteobacteria bacterium]